ncbi:MAG: hypothetical protein ACE367_17495 [Acidimicrobiales bacterium]
MSHIAVPWRRVLGLITVWLGLAALFAAAPAGAQRARVAIGPVAQCHGARCFVRLDVEGATAQTAQVRVGPVTRRLRLAPGSSTRVVQVPRRALARPVRVTVGDVTARARVERRAMPVNRARSRCARLGATDAYLSVGPPNDLDGAVNLSSIGTLRIAVLFVDFPGAAGQGDPRPANQAWMDAGIDVLERTSNGRFSVDIVATTPGWTRMPASARSYGFDDGITYDEHLVYLQDAIDAADADVDFSDVDLPLVVVPDAANLFGSAAFRGLPGALVADEGVLGPAVTFGSDAEEVSGVIFEHELLHTLGLADLYAFFEPQQHEFVGLWDWMGSIFEPRTDLFVWNKTRLGWLRPNQTLCGARRGSTSAVLAPSAGPRGTKSVFVRTGRFTGVTIEHRRPSDLDPGVCRSGVLVATLDSRVETGLGPIRVAGGRSDDRGCGTGPRSDATLRVGQSVRVDGATVRVVGRQGGRLEVVIDAG